MRMRLYEKLPCSLKNYRSEKVETATLLIIIDFSSLYYDPYSKIKLVKYLLLFKFFYYGFRRPITDLFLLF